MTQFAKRYALMLALMLTSTPVLAADWEGGNAVNGEKVFRKCAACHTLEEGGDNRIGPNLYGIVGRKTASHEGYAYSPAMKALGDKGHVWTGPELFNYLEKPKAHVPGTSMSFVGLKKPEDRKDVIAYLQTGGKKP